MNYPELPKNVLPNVTYIACMKPRDKSWAINRWLEHWAVIIVHDGSIGCEIDGIATNVNAGEVFLISPGVWRKTWVNSDKFTISALDFAAPRSPSATKSAVFKPTDIEALTEIVKKMNYLYLSHPDGWQMDLNAMMVLFLSRLFYKSSVTHPAVEKMKHYIIEYYMHPITAKELSSLVNLDPAYCGKLFKAQQNCSIPQYINQVRVKVACELLDQSGYSLEEIASMCGFCDKFHLGKNFKSVMGISPKSYARLKAATDQKLYGGM